MTIFPEITEWMDAYERDISVLISARQALLSHPLRRTTPEQCNTSLCRFLAVTMIGAIEHLLESWKESDRRGILQRYFDSGASNGEKVKNLFEAFRAASIDLDRDVFDDYLAIKYLRNAIVHARWKDYEKDWVRQRGFPLDVQELTKAHWEQMLRVNDNITWYLRAVFMRGAEKLAKTLPSEQLPDEPPVLSSDDIARVLWNNLEAVNWRLLQAFENATTSERLGGSWTNKEEWWTTCWEEGRKNPDLFAAQRQLVEPALFSWDEYYRLNFERANLTVSDVERARATLLELHPALDPRFGHLFWPGKASLAKASLADRRELLRAQLRSDAQIDLDRAISALDIGSEVYGKMVNSTPCQLFAVRLPIVEPQKLADFLPRAKYSILAMEVSTLWHGLLEGGGMAGVSSLASLRAMLDRWSSSLG